MVYKISQSVRTGIHHLQAGEPGQDRVKVLRREPVFCAALADGAGSRSRSGEGAETVTQTITRLFCQSFEELWQLPEQELIRQLLTACLDALERLDAPLSDFASTLLFCAGHQDGRIITGHLGDGAQILVREDNSLQLFSAPENGGHRNETFFVTSQTADAHLRICRQKLSAPGTLLLMSDGMAESLYQYNTQSPAPVCSTLAGWLRAKPEAVINQALDQHMKTTFSDKSTDDLSLVIIDWQQPEQETTEQRSISNDVRSIIF